MRTVILLMSLLAVSACDERGAPPAPTEGPAPAIAEADTPQSPAAPTVPSAAPSTAPNMPSTPTTSSTPVTPTTPDTPPPAAALALDGEGLRIFNAASGSSRAIAFGTARADTRAMLTATQGGPPIREGENIDCGATMAVWRGGLTTWFARDRFVGWSVADATSPLSTAGGLKVGSTRDEVEHGASVATITPSSLGEEFTAGGIAGLLASAAPDARVSTLWAGNACVAR